MASITNCYSKLPGRNRYLLPSFTEHPGKPRLIQLGYPKAVQEQDRWEICGWEDGQAKLVDSHILQHPTREVYPRDIVKSETIDFDI